MRINQLIQYYRLRHIQTIKELAETLNVTARTLSSIEKGTKPSQKTWEKIIRVIPYQAFSDVESEALQMALNQFFKAILYVEYDAATTQFHQLNDANLSQSTFVIPWTLYQYMFAIHTQYAGLDLDELDHELELLVPYMTDAERDIYTVERAGYFFVKGQLSESLKHGERVLKSVDNRHLKAINLFLIGATGINEVGRIEASIHYLEEAEAIFLEFANYRRARRCQAFQLIGMVHGHRYSEVLPHYHALKSAPVSEQGNAQLDAFIEGTLARYYAFIEDYDQAYSVLSQITYQSSTNFFLMLYTMYQTAHQSELLTHINQLESWAEPINNPVHRRCAYALKSWLKAADVSHFASNLKAAFEAALKTNDYLSIMLTSKVAIDALKNAKRYKEAYHLANQKLAILRENT